MQNMESSKLFFGESKSTTSIPDWYIIWLKNWNYSHWLITSTISSVLLAEVGAVILTAYPGFLSNLWLSLGITSALSISLLSVGILGSLGLATGWLIYAGHLAYQSFNTLEFDYQPLMQLWSSNHEAYGFILKKLIADDNFLKLTQYIQNYPGAKGLHEFLQNPENAASVRQILYLLDKIWSTEHISQKVKIVLLHLLSQHVQSKDAEEHLHNIFSLCEILWENQHLNEDLIQQVFQNSSLLKPYLKELISLADNQELLHQCIMEPSFIPFQIAANSVGEEDNIQSLYPYLKGLHDGEKLPGPVSRQIYLALNSYYSQSPEIFIDIWKKLTTHPQLQVIETLIEEMQHHENGEVFVTNPDKLKMLLNLFTGPENSSLGTDEILEKITDKSILCELLLKLDAIGSLTSAIVEKVLLEKPLVLSLQLINIYQKRIFQADKTSTAVLVDMNKLLLDNEAMIAKINCLDGRSSRYMTELNKIVENQLLSAESPILSAVVTASDGEGDKLPTKKKNPWHKIQKILNLRPHSQTNASAKPTLESIPEVVEEDDNDNAKKTTASTHYARWTSFFNDAESKGETPTSAESLGLDNHL